MSPIKTGFVGLSTRGWASNALGPSLYKSSNYSLVAVCTSSADTAKTSAEKYGAIVGHTIKAYHGATDEIANDPEVDFVAISIKAPLHRQALKPVIDAGKNFFIEWPAGNSMDETIEFATLAKEKGLKAMVGLQGRQNPIVRKIKEIIASGKIGKVLASSIIALGPRESSIWAPETSSSSRYVHDPGNGATALDILVGHLLDPFTFTLGEFASVNATFAHQYKEAVILDSGGKPTGEIIPSTSADQFAFTGMLKSGAIASTVYRTGYKSTPGREQFTWIIDGEEGSIRVAGSHVAAAFLHIHDAQLYLNGELVDVPAIGLFGYLSNAWEEFAKDANTYATLDDAVKLHRLLEAIRTSAKEGRTVLC